MSFVERSHAGNEVFVGDGVVKSPGFEVVGVAHENCWSHFGVEFAPACCYVVVQFHNFMFGDVHVGRRTPYS